MTNYVKDFRDDLVRTSERVRAFTVEGKDYRVRCHDPYGFWRFEGARIPEEIDGSYSTYDACVRAAEAYERKRTPSGQISPDKRVSTKVKKTREALNNGA